MMKVAVSPSREFQRRRRLSIDAEDELFKSLKEVQELNNSQRQRRAASPGNHSGRVKTRSIDLNRAGSPGKHSGRRERRSVDATKASSPGSYSARRQRNGPKNNRSTSPKGNNSSRRTARSATPPKGEVGNAVGNSPLSLALQRQSPGGAVRRPNRMRRRASTGTHNDDSPGVIVTKGRTARRSDPTNDPETPPKGKGRTKQRSASPKKSKTCCPSSSPLVMRSFNRRNVVNTSPSGSPTNRKINVYPANRSPSQSPKRTGTKEWSEMFLRANLLKNAKPPRLDNSTTSWASFDDDIIDSDAEKSESDRTDSTKPISERTGAHSDHSRTENAALKNLLDKLRDPAELERMKAEREGLNKPNHSPQASVLEHDKVTEQVSSRNLKTFLQRSKRGYGQQANLDGLSVMK